MDTPRNAKTTEALLAIRPYRDGDHAGVVALWHACDLVVPHNDPAADIRAKLDFQPDLLLVAISRKALVGTVMVGYEGHRGWINYLAVAPGHRRRGLGSALMEAARKRLEALGCPKINLQVRRSNAHAIAFYRALGFTEDDVVSLGKRLT